MDSSSHPPPERPALPAAPQTLWKRLTGTRRGAAGLGIVAAALLLWPFSGLSWVPWLAGLAVLVLLAVLRLDRLLSGWVWHVGGLVVVAGLMVSTTPWAWALAASIGVLVAGLFRLPAWRLAAVGAVLCLASGVAFTLAGVRTAEAARAENRAANEQTYALTGERTPERVLPALLEGIVQGDATAVCGLLDVPARDAFTAAAGAPDCAAAVAAFRSAAGTTVGDYEDLDTSTAETGGTWVTDGCRTAWAGPALGGPDLGRVVVRRSPPPGGTYFLAGFAPC
jgi:hypothetical protein